MEMKFSGDGTYQEVVGYVDRVPDFDPRAGDHLWIVNATYRWGGPSEGPSYLDTENLILITGPGCYYCEQVWTPQLATRRCKGHP